MPGPSDRNKQRRACDYRWETEFGRWVAEFGVRRILAELRRDPELRVTERTVYDWLSGRRIPRPSRASALVQISHGRISLETIYRHPYECRQLASRARLASCSGRTGSGRIG